MNTECSARIARHWPCHGSLAAALWLWACVAWGQPYQAQEESLQRFFAALSGPLGVSVVVSRQVAPRQVSGTFDFDAPQQVLEAVALQQGLIWHRDGQVLYLYNAAEARNSAVVLRHIYVDSLRGVLRRTGLDESSYPLRESGRRTFYVTGPPSYVDQVLRLAQLMDRQRAPSRVVTPAFGVVQVLNTDVADRQYGAGADTITVPGMASMVGGRLSSELKGQLADGSLTLIAYPDTNSLLIKGKPDQVSLIKQWVAELDVLTRPNDVSLWQADAGHERPKALAGAGGQSSLTSQQHERVQRAFRRQDRESLHE